MKSFKYIFGLLIFFFFMSFVDASEKEINIYLFYSNSCPHCAQEEIFLEKYANENEDVNFYTYEISANYENRELWFDVQEIFDRESGYIPYTVIGNQIIIGYASGNTDVLIEKIVDYYRHSNYRDLIGEHLGTVEVREDIVMDNIDIENENITVPIFGKIDLKSVSLFVLSIIMGVIDGFNPCAMWILLFLVTMLLGMKDRKKMWILGITFLTTSALMYALIMTTWLNLASSIIEINIIRILIGIFAISMATSNIYKYFKERKQDGCTVVKDSKRKKIIDRIKHIVIEKKFGLAIIGIILLAISVNLIELICSATLPLMYANILALNDPTLIQSIFYIFIYILFFLIDDIVIFVLAMITLKVTAASSKYTKYSHLIGGIIMLIIGILLIFFPNILTFAF
ncbi:MAG: hypothetical protein PHN54_01695 [Bacilli bacterium]|nr:hypothetical protein [Bacilli bacterium]